MNNLINKKTIPIIIIAICILVISVTVILRSGALAGGVKSETVATINGEAITKQELYDAMVKQNGAEVLDVLIADRILILELQKKNLSISDEEVQAKLEKTIEQYGGIEQFEQMIASYGYTMDSIKKDLRTNLAATKLLGDQITVAEEDIKSFFEQNKAYFDQPEQVEASHILVDSEEKAKEVKAKLAAGGDFAALAKEYSKDESNKDNGGQLGFFGKGDMVKEFEDAAFALEIGKISELVKTEYGYHIIKVTNKKAAKAATIEESREQIKEQLFSEKLPEVYNTWMQEKMSEYKIEKQL